MQCIDATERLLAEEAGADPELEQHLANCARCVHTAQGLERVDELLRSSLVVTPPTALQRQIMHLALAAAPSPAEPWWQRFAAVFGQLAQRPQGIAAQGLAMVVLALASWTTFAWLSTFQPVLGDVGYAMELVAASPAVIYLGGVQIDWQSLGLWSVVGIAGWLVSENGPIGRSIGSGRLQLP